MLGNTTSPTASTDFDNHISERYLFSYFDQYCADFDMHCDGGWNWNLQYGSDMESLYRNHNLSGNLHSGRKRFADYHSRLGTGHDKI